MKAPQEWSIDWSQRANKSSPLYETKFIEFIRAIQADAQSTAAQEQPDMQEINAVLKDALMLLCAIVHCNKKFKTLDPKVFKKQLKRTERLFLKLPKSPPSDSKTVGGTK